jgi:hypothetical protein
MVLWDVMPSSFVRVANILAEPATSIIRMEVDLLPCHEVITSVDVVCRCGAARTVQSGTRDGREADSRSTTASAVCSSQ